MLLRWWSRPCFTEIENNKVRDGTGGGGGSRFEVTHLVGGGICADGARQSWCDGGTSCGKFVRGNCRRRCRCRCRCEALDAFARKGGSKIKRGDAESGRAAEDEDSMMEMLHLVCARKSSFRFLGGSRGRCFAPQLRVEAHYSNGACCCC